MSAGLLRVQQANPSGRNASKSRRYELAQYGQLFQMSPVSSFHDESSVRVEKRANLLLARVHRSAFSMSGAVGPSLKTKENLKAKTKQRRGKYAI